MTEPAGSASSGAALDRAADGRRRDAAWLQEQAEHPRARALIAGSAGVAVEGHALALAPLGRREGALLLGLDERGPVFALDEDAPPPGEGRPPMIGSGGRRGEPTVEAAGRVGLRDAVAFLSPAEGGLVAYASSLLNWHRTHRFCANCGTATETGEGGHTRRCPRCGVEHHPRTDPVVIMLVTGGDSVLLGRQPTWPARRYSALAGFVGPGESLEAAVRREVEEEAGVEVGEPVFVSSQPWPFPASLMIGFEVPFTAGEPGGTDEELEDVRWFTRAEVAEAARESAEAWERPPDSEAPLLLPPSTAIARRLLDGWLARGA